MERRQESPAAKKSLGQNFLVDRNIAAKIVAALEIGSRDKVLEIGPGRGALSTLIRDSGPDVFVALEKDPHWARELKKAMPSVQVLNVDGLAFAWERLGAGEEDVRPWKVIGNLPYNVASPLIWDILGQAPGLARLVCMVQKEVGLRLAAKPGNKVYGALSVWVQSFSRVELLFSVSPQVFRPRPKVDSAVLRFTPVEKKQKIFSGRALSFLVKRCFQQRRKQLRTILKDYGADVVLSFLAEHDLSATARPEELSPEQFQILSNLLESRFPA